MPPQPKLYNPKEIASIICNQLRNEDDLIAVYIFGSQAEEKSHAHSDIDVAILFRNDSGPRHRFQRLLAIGTKLELALPTAVDVVDLRQAPPLLLFQVLKHGKLLLDFDRTERCLFEMHAIQVYYDAKPYLDYQRIQTLQRIREQGLGNGYNRHRRALEKVRRLRGTLARSASSAA